MKPAHRIPMGAFLQTAASLLWLPQAGAVAYAVGRLAQGGMAQETILPAACVAVIGLVRTGLDSYGSSLCNAQALAALQNIRREGVEALQQQSPLDPKRITSGEAASLLAEQTDRLLPYYSRFGTARLKASVIPLLIFAVIFPISWVAALILLFALPPIPIFSALIGWQAKHESEKHLAQIGTMNGFLLDRLRGLSTLRALGAVDITARQFRAFAENLRVRTMKVLRVAFLTSAVLELFSALGVAFVAVYTGFHLLGELPFGAWGSRLSLAEGLFILMLAPAFFEPLRELSAVWHDRATAQAALKALEKITEPRLKVLGTGTPASPLIHTAPRITCESVGFADHSGAGISFQIAAGEKVALWGASGSGKTLLLSLIAGLAPHHGTITVHDHILNAQTADAVRQSMAWLGQKPHFRAGSVLENLRLHAPELPRHEARRLLDSVGLSAIPCDRQIGENGAGLSGGETLRLALARIKTRANTRLILADEPTAHLDRQTAAAITELLLGMAASTTMIIATHDPEIAARMDRVIPLAACAGEALPQPARRAS